jgi:hypothetical protein
MFALCASIILPHRFLGLIRIQALLDTCHSGIPLLDLPHHHCNSAYVPWRSKCKRRTKSWQNVTGAFTIFYPSNGHNQLLTPVIQCVGTWRVRVTFRLRRPSKRSDASFFPCTVIEDLISSSEAALPSSLRTAIANTIAWSISAPPKPRSVLPLSIEQRVAPARLAKWEAYDSSLTNIVRSFPPFVRRRFPYSYHLL